MTVRSRQLRDLLARRAALASRAPRLAEILRGTLRERYVRCGKPGCHCEKGQGHGPFIYLSVTLGVGRTVQITIAPEDQEAVRRLVGNYQRMWETIEAVSAINRELLQSRLLPLTASSRTRHPDPRRRRRG